MSDPLASPIPPSPDGGERELAFCHPGFAGAGERYGKGRTAHTIHVWWARRPHAAMRAVVFASLCRRSDPEALAMLQTLGGSVSLPPEPFKRAGRMIQEQWGGPPRLLDMFGGGGTIPLEALRLGAEVHSADFHPMAVFIQRCLLNASRVLSPSALSEQLERSGKRVLQRLAEDTAALYPLRPRIATYLWTHAMACSGCGYRFFLTRRPWLSTRKGIFLRSGAAKADAQTLLLSENGPDPPFASPWQGRSGTARCPRCGHPNRPRIQDCETYLVARVRARGKQGKEYESGTAPALPDPDWMAHAQAGLLNEMDLELPGGRFFAWSGIVNPPLYGLDRPTRLFTPRQQLSLLFLIRALKLEHQRLISRRSRPVADAVLGFLSALIDQMIDWNCRLSTWIPQNEQVGRAFCGPGVSMTWDFAETDPVSQGPGNLWGKLRRIIQGAEGLADLSGTAEVIQAPAQALPFPAAHFDAVVTDPPYYDNLYYSVLAGFFFPWKRMALAPVEPALFAAPFPDVAAELVASARRGGGQAAAYRNYRRALGQALCEARRVLRPNGVFTMVYGHGAIWAWTAFIHAFRRTDFYIQEVFPLNVERRARPRAMRSAARHVCMAFLATPRPGARPLLGQEGFFKALNGLIQGGWERKLRARGWGEGDIAAVLFARAAALLANARPMPDLDDPSALDQAQARLGARFNGFKIIRRKTL